MTKIVINACYGGYELSPAAQSELGVSCLFALEEDRTNPALVACVEKLGEAASGSCAKLKVVEIPDGAEWELYAYDGSEWIAERHRTWQ